MPSHACTGMQWRVLALCVLRRLLACVKSEDQHEWSFPSSASTTSAPSHGELPAPLPLLLSLHHRAGCVGFTVAAAVVSHAWNPDNFC